MADQLECSKKKINLIHGRIGPDNPCDLMRL
jgi:hypothetical protein